MCRNVLCAVSDFDLVDCSFSHLGHVCCFCCFNGIIGLYIVIQEVGVIVLFEFVARARDRARAAEPGLRVHASRQRRHGVHQLVLRDAERLKATASCQRRRVRQAAATAQEAAQCTARQVEQRPRRVPWQWGQRSPSIR